MSKDCKKVFVRKVEYDYDVLNYVGLAIIGLFFISAMYSGLIIILSIILIMFDISIDFFGRFSFLEHIGLIFIFAIIVFVVSCLSYYFVKRKVYFEEERIR